MDEIGQRLRAARIEKGLTIDDLQQTTKIQKRYLIAIEEGQFDQLPGEFYVRAFMKQYAQAVGLDSKELLGDTVIETPEQGSIVSGVNKQLNNERKAASKGSLNTNTIKNYIPQAIVVILVIIILGAIFAIATQNKANNQTVIPDKSKVVKKEDTSKKADSSKDSNVSKKTNKTEKKDESKSMAITAVTGDTSSFIIKNLPKSDNKLTVTAGSTKAWIQVSIDGASTWAGALAANQTQQVAIPDGAKKIQVHSGNARATSIKINETDVNITDLATGKFVRTFNFDIQ